MSLPEPEQVPSDTELMAQIVGRDESAFETLYDRYSGAIYGVCLRVLHSDSAAQATLTDIFMELWEKAERFDASRGSFRAYAMTLTRSRAIDRMRSEKTRAANDKRLKGDLTQESSIADQVSDPADGVVSVEDRKQLEQALAELPVAHREALELAYFGGLTQKEIADRTGLPLGTVKTNIRQGLLKLRRTFAKLGFTRERG